MRIPTLLALAILVLALTGGISLYLINHNLISNSEVAQPKNILVSNLSDTSATISWQTDQPAIGIVSWGDSDSLGNSQSDFRDNDIEQPHLSHLITLTNLNPNTSYYFKVKSNTQFYPDKVLSFKSGPTLTNNPQKTSSLLGVVISQNLKPAEEALIELKIQGASLLTALTNASGNFILPLINLRKEDLSDYFSLNNTSATLVISQGQNHSEVNITLPSTTPLKITLGQNQLSSPSASPSASLKINLDLNGDGKVNANDAAILLLNFGRKKGDPKFNPLYDLNSDGVIDQKDLELLKQAIK